MIMMWEESWEGILYLLGVLIPWNVSLFLFFVYIPYSGIKAFPSCRDASLLL
jgi:hypothetical protein